MDTDFIYCAAGGRRYSEIAIRNGFRYGAQLPGTVSQPPLFFADQDFKKPNRANYIAALSAHRPVIATVLDWEREDQFTEVMSWAEEAAQYVQDAVIIVPKVRGSISRIPRTINGKAVRLGYSAPTSYGATTLPLDDFRGWSVHCLGGSPVAQRRIHTVLHCDSIDGNYLQKLSRHHQVFSPGCTTATNHLYPYIREMGIDGRYAPTPYLVFELSCIAYHAYFAGVDGRIIYDQQMDRAEQILGKSAITARLQRLF